MRSKASDGINIPRILSIVYYLSSFLILLCAGYVISGFFLSKSWFADLTSNDNDAMMAAAAKLHFRAGLHTLMAPSDFSDFDSSSSSLGSAQKCPASAVPCPDSVTPLLPDASRHCCPQGYRCFVHMSPKSSGAMFHLTPALCGEINPTLTKELRLSNEGISRCMLLLGLLDRTPRFPPPSGEVFMTPAPTQPSSTPRPTLRPTSPRRRALQEQASVLELFTPVSDFFLNKLVDLLGVLSFASIGLVFLFTLLDTITSFMPTSASELRPTAAGASSSSTLSGPHPDHSGFSVTCASLLALSSPFPHTAPPPALALRYFGVLRLSLYCMLLLTPAAAGLLSAHFDSVAFYEALEGDRCFARLDNEAGSSPSLASVIPMFKQRVEALTWMRMFVVMLFVFFTLRCVVFYLASRFHHRFLKAKARRQSRPDDDVFAIPVDDDALNHDHHHSRHSASSNVGSYSGDDEDDEENEDGDNDNQDDDDHSSVYDDPEVQRFPPKPAGYKSRYDSDYESDEEDTSHQGTLTLSSLKSNSPASAPSTKPISASKSILSSSATSSASSALPSSTTTVLSLSSTLSSSSSSPHSRLTEPAPFRPPQVDMDSFQQHLANNSRHFVADQDNMVFTDTTVIVTKPKK